MRDTDKSLGAVRMVHSAAMDLDDVDVDIFFDASPYQSEVGSEYSNTSMQLVAEEIARGMAEATPADSSDLNDSSRMSFSTKEMIAQSELKKYAVKSSGLLEPAYSGWHAWNCTHTELEPSRVGYEMCPAWEQD